MDIETLKTFKIQIDILISLSKIWNTDQTLFQISLFMDIQTLLIFNPNSKSRVTRTFFAGLNN